MRKTVTRLLRSIDRRRRRINATRLDLADRLRRRGAASPDADYDPVIEHLDAELAAVRDRLLDAELAYGVDQDTLRKCRRWRAVTYRGLRDLHAPIPRLLENLGIIVHSGARSSCPDGLVREVGATLETLRGLERPPAPAGGLRLDPTPLISQLEAAQSSLVADLGAVSRAETEVKLSHRAANDAFGRAGRVLSWVSRTVESLDGLAAS